MLLTFLVTILLSNSASAPNARKIIQDIETRYRRATTLKAQFFESYTDGKGSGSAESGTVYFSKPGRMRWEYESPEEKLFLVDGKNVWFYVPADRTVSRAEIGESSDWRTPLAFLTGKTNFARLCRTIDIVDPKSSGDAAETSTGVGNAVLRCVPRALAGATGEEIRDVLLEADPDARLVRIVVRQPGNLTTEFRFGNWEENLPVAETKFHFVVPSGVAVVDQASLAATIH